MTEKHGDRRFDEESVAGTNSDVCSLSNKMIVGMKLPSINRYQKKRKKHKERKDMVTNLVVLAEIVRCLICLKLWNQLDSNSKLFINVLRLGTTTPSTLQRQENIVTLKTMVGLLLSASLPPCGLLAR